MRDAFAWRCLAEGFDDNGPVRNSMETRIFFPILLYVSVILGQWRPLFPLDRHTGTQKAMFATIIYTYRWKQKSLLFTVNYKQLWLEFFVNLGVNVITFWNDLTVLIISFRPCRLLDVLKESFTPKWKFAENVLALRPFKMQMNLCLHQNRYGEI